MKLLPALGMSVLAVAAVTPDETNTSDDDNRRNLPPVCIIDDLNVIACQGSETSVVLNGSQSFDPDETKLDYFWESCPNSSFDNPRSATPTLTIDTSITCDLVCGVRLHVSDGMHITSCRIDVVLSPSVFPHVDLDPLSCPNGFDVNGFADLARYSVGLLGNDFDVTQVDTATLTLSRVVGGSDMMLGGSFGTILPVDGETVMNDVSAPVEDGEVCECQVVPGDQISDIQMNFIKQEMVDEFLLEAEDTNTVIQLVLSGKLLSGEPFTARDCMLVINGPPPVGAPR